MIKVYDVLGDGNCYYRCIWNIIRHEPKMVDVVMLYDIYDEDEGLHEIRYFVAMCIRFQRYAQELVKSMIGLAREMEDVMVLAEQYPILEVVRDIHATWDALYDEIADLIENTNVYASSLEQSIIARMMQPFCSIIVVSPSVQEWEQAMTKVECHEYVALLINIENEHYNYVRLAEACVVPKQDYVLALKNILEIEENGQEPIQV